MWVSVLCVSTLWRRVLDCSCVVVAFSGHYHLFFFLFLMFLEMTRYVLFAKIFILPVVQRTRTVLIIIDGHIMIIPAKFNLNPASRRCPLKQLLTTQDPQSMPHI